MLAVLLLMSMAVSAGRIDEAEAMQRAQAFLHERGLRQMGTAPMRMAVRGHRAKAPVASESDYYVFNIGSNGGFVVVSGDDRTKAILGYADRGAIDEGDMPDALRYLLDGYAQQMAWLDEHPDVAAAAAGPSKVAATRHAIAPLTKTLWDQGAPYNNYAPTISTGKTVTGCVATAMAQVMYYHRWPMGETVAVPGYTMSTESMALDSLAPTTFDWDAMATYYAPTATGTSADAVAKLLQYCGWSLHMNYNVNQAGGSSSYNFTVAEALKAYFGYASTVSYAQREHYSYREWIELIYNELANSRPVVLGGQSTGGGHSFVCDGYDTDDYFYINWGWGGTSNGYFRLSALAPDEQGIGGSSTLDGFSYSQDAIVGIQPGNGEVAEPCLGTYMMEFCQSSASTQTLTRASFEEAFTGMNVSFRVINYLYAANTFDFALLLTDADGRVLATWIEVKNHSLGMFSYTGYDMTDLSTPAGLADGTYYIKAVSRVAGATEWQECYEGARMSIRAEVSGNTMTLTVPVQTSLPPTLAGITFGDNPTVGYDLTVTAHLTGGETDYHKNLLLVVDGYSVMGKQVDIPAGETVDVVFSYTPWTSGTNTVSIYAGNTVLNSAEVTVAASDATNNLSLTFAATIDNKAPDKAELYGNALRATVTATNASATNTYSGRLNCTVCKWAFTDLGNGQTQISWSGVATYDYPLVVEKQGSTDVPIAIDGLETGGVYSFLLRYVKNNTVVEGLHVGYYPECLTVTEGYSLGDDKGELTLCGASTAINAADACFADLRSLSSLAGVTVTPSSNPNCLYLLAADAVVPAGLEGCNVVKGTEADAITLTDGYSFFAPFAFHATSISYTRTFDLGAAGNSGWNSIMLPFAVQTVVCNGRLVDWFHSASDTGKNFWLRSFVGDGEGRVDFDDATSMEANKPYIIAVPDDRFGADWQMTDKPVTFSASDVSLDATATSSFTGNFYKMCGSTTVTPCTDIYVLNSNGSKFVRIPSASVPGFRAWFAPVHISSLQLASLSIGSGEVTGIALPLSPASASPSADVWYTIDGRRLSSKPAAAGLYIHNGNKMVIK